MKALILAAGFGSRLAPITDNLPKSLVPVNGKPILEKQIENLLKNGITDITIISGYLSSVLVKFVTEKYPNIQIIESVNYRTTNNMYSAYIARHKFKGHEFLMMNADVYYDSNAITKLLEYKNTNAIVVDVGSYMEESMKVTLNQGRIEQISKQIQQVDSYGCSIDVYRFSKEGSTAFFNKAIEYIEIKNEKQLWSEVALNDILLDCTFVPCPLEGRWYEIDDLEDLKKAEELFK